MSTKDHERRTLAADRLSNNELLKKTGEKPVQDQLRRRKWKWLEHTLRRSDDSVAKQALQ